MDKTIVAHHLQNLRETLAEIGQLRVGQASEMAAHLDVARAQLNVAVNAMDAWEPIDLPKHDALVWAHEWHGKKLPKPWRAVTTLIEERDQWKERAVKSELALLALSAAEPVRMSQRAQNHVLSMLRSAHRTLDELCKLGREEVDRSTMREIRADVAEAQRTVQAFQNFNVVATSQSDVKAHPLYKAIVGELEATQKKLDEAKHHARLATAQRDDVWNWVPEDKNDAASITCPVVMSATTLRSMLNDIREGKEALNIVINHRQTMTPLLEDRYTGFVLGERRIEELTKKMKAELDELREARVNHSGLALAIIAGEGPWKTDVPSLIELVGRIKSDRQALRRELNELRPQLAEVRAQVDRHVSNGKLFFETRSVADLAARIVELSNAGH